MDGRVVLLTNSSWIGEVLANRLLEAGIDLRLIVREDVADPIQYSTISRLARRIIGHSIMDRIGHMRLEKVVRDTLDWERDQRAIAEEWAQHELKARGYHAGWPANTPFVLTRSANTPEVVDRVRSEEPDLLVVFGTRMLKPQLLALPTKGSLNAHSSILPHYKGGRSEFWQCYHNDPRFAGITIHQVTPRVDDGDILFQCAANSEWPTTPYKLRMVNSLAVLEHFPRVVMQYLAGSTTAITQGPTEIPVYRFRDVTMEKRIGLKQRLERRRSPSE